MKTLKNIDSHTNVLPQPFQQCNSNAVMLYQHRIKAECKLIEQVTLNQCLFSPIALRTVKTLRSLGRFECNRVKKARKQDIEITFSWTLFQHVT